MGEKNEIDCGSNPERVVKTPEVEPDRIYSGAEHPLFELITVPFPMELILRRAVSRIF